MKRLALPLLVFLFLASPPATSFEIPPKPAGYVTDSAGILSASARSQLESFLKQYESQTSHQVVVAIFNSMDGGSLEDISIRLAEAWKIGQKETDNGVILLIFIQDRKMRIEVGYGLEGQLTDAQSGMILRDVIAPNFQRQNYDAGVVAGVQAIIQALAGTGEAVAQPNKRHGPVGLPVNVGAILKIISIIAFILFLLDLGRYARFKSGHRFYKKRYSFWEWWFRFGALLFVFNVLFRILFHVLLSGGRGGYSGSRGGGGFSGGGGSFGGGGASGSW